MLVSRPLKLAMTHAASLELIHHVNMIPQDVSTGRCRLEAPCDGIGIDMALTKPVAETVSGNQDRAGRGRQSKPAAERYQQRRQ